MELLYKENVIVDWVNDKRKITVTEDDLMINSDAEIGYWRYDIRWKDTIICNSGTFSELQPGACNRAQFRESKGSNRVVPIPEESDSSDAGYASDNNHQPLYDSDETEGDNPPLAKTLAPDCRRLLWMQKPANFTQCEREGVRGETTKIKATSGYFEHYCNSAFVSEVVYQSSFFAKQKNANSSFNLTKCITISWEV